MASHENAGAVLRAAEKVPPRLPVWTLPASQTSRLPHLKTDHGLHMVQLSITTYFKVSFHYSMVTTTLMKLDRYFQEEPHPPWPILLPPSSALSAVSPWSFTRGVVEAAPTPELGHWHAFGSVNYGQGGRHVLSF